MSHHLIVLCHMLYSALPQPLAPHCVCVCVRACVCVHAVELVWLGHTYHLGLLETAAVCANAGVCLEDTIFETFANAFSRLGDAVTEVSCYVWTA